MVLLNRILTYEFSILAALFVGFLGYFKMNKNEKLFLFYLVAILLFDAWAMSLGVKGINNWHVYNYLTGLEMILLTLYLNVIFKSKKLRNYLSLSCIGYFVYYTIHISVLGIDSLFMPLSMVSGLILSLFFLQFLIYGQTEVKWINVPDNWFALGSIFYLYWLNTFSSSFPFFNRRKKRPRNNVV